jgi:hypothetical protein
VLESAPEIRAISRCCDVFVAVAVLRLMSRPNPTLQSLQISISNAADGARPSAEPRLDFPRLT